MSETAERTHENMALVPRWAAIAAVVMLALGIGIGATRESRARSGAISMLNGADIRLVTYADGKPIVDGYEAYFGRVVLRDHRREYEDLLGECTTRPERAQAVFREVLRSGTWQGRALACHMAFYLAQSDRLELQDLDAMAQLLVDPNEDLRRVAQSELGTLVLVRKTESNAAYETLGPPPAGLKERFSAAAVEADLPEPAKRGEWLRMKWSSPEACLSWWRTFGPRLKWDAGLKRFTIAK